MELVAERGLQRLHRGEQALLLAGELLFRDHAVRERARERLELLRLLLDPFVFRLFVEPTGTGHVSSYNSLTNCFSAVSRSCSAARPPATSVFCRIAGGRNCRSVHSRIAAVSCSSRSRPWVDGMNSATTPASASRVMVDDPASVDTRRARPTMPSMSAPDR